jgi:hypothetical protein
MATVAQPQKTYNRIAHHAEWRNVHGMAIRDTTGRVWFVSDNDQIQELFDADIADIALLGRMDLAAEQRRLDLLAGSAPRIACDRLQEVL